MLLVGYSEGSPSQRRIDWRCADSPSLRKLLTIPLTESTLAHTSMTHIRERMPQCIHGALFEWVLRVAASKKLFWGIQLPWIPPHLRRMPRLCCANLLAG